MLYQSTQSHTSRSLPPAAPVVDRFAMRTGGQLPVKFTVMFAHVVFGYDKFVTAHESCQAFSAQPALMTMLLDSGRPLRVVVKFIEMLIHVLAVLR